jgi:hypothetical protein
MSDVSDWRKVMKESRRVFTFHRRTPMENVDSDLYCELFSLLKQASQQNVERLSDQIRALGGDTSLGALTSLDKEEM